MIYLIEHGADANVKIDNETPLSLIKRRQNESLENYLIYHLNKKRKSN